MRRLSSVLIFAACFLLYVLPLGAEEVEPVLDDEEGCEVEAFFAGVQCVGEGGALQWQIHHPSLWAPETDYFDDLERLILEGAPEGDGEDEEATEEELQRNEGVWISDDVDVLEKKPAPFAPPITVGGRTFYSNNFHLLEVDVEEGAVIDRVRFPAHISKLSTDEEEDWMTVMVTFSGRDGQGTRTLDLRYHLDGPAPAQTEWSLVHPDHYDLGAVALRGAFEDFQYIQSRIMKGIDPDWHGYSYFHQPRRFEENFDDIDDRQMETIIDGLEGAGRMDRTSPFFAAYIGLWHQVRGEEEAADQAFAQALETENVHWRDWMRLFKVMENYGVSEVADRAFELGIDGAEEVGISLERRQTTLARNTTLDPNPLSSHSLIVQAMERKEAPEVDRLARRDAELFPNLEGAHISWFNLANWMEEEGHPELAAEWRERAEANEAGSCSMAGPGSSWPSQVIGHGLVLSIVVPALIILLFLVGLRSGAARRRHEEESPEASAGVKGWMPRLKGWDLLLLGVLFVAALIVPPVAGVYPEAIESMSMSEITLNDDGLASPTVRDNVEEFVDSPARTELLAIMDAEYEALVAGEELPEKENICPLLMETVITDARHYQWESFKDLSFLKVAYPDEFGGVSVGSLKPAMIPVLLLVLAVIFAIGVVMGRKTPRLTRLVRYIVPGSVFRPAPLADIALLSTIGAVMMILSTQNEYFQALVNFNPAGNALELDVLSVGGEVIPASWVMAALSVLALVVVVHLAFVVLDIRAWRAESDDDTAAS